MTSEAAEKAFIAKLAAMFRAAGFGERQMAAFVAALQSMERRKNTTDIYTQREMNDGTAERDAKVDGETFTVGPRGSARGQVIGALRKAAERVLYAER